jgi:hypothetical protein
LIRFQKDESKYHPLMGNDKFSFHHARGQLANLRLINYHLDNLINTPLQNINWTSAEKELILSAINDLADSLQNAAEYDPAKHQEQFRQLTKLFWEDSEEITKKNKQHPTHFPPELIIMYELLAIYNLVTKFFRPAE